MLLDKLFFGKINDFNLNRVQLKQLLQKRLMNVFFEEFPHLRDKVVHVSTGSPVSNNFYIGSQQGEVSDLHCSILQLLVEVILLVYLDSIRSPLHVYWVCCLRLRGAGN